MSSIVVQVGSRVLNDLVDNEDCIFSSNPLFLVDHAGMDFEEETSVSSSDVLSVSNNYVRSCENQNSYGATSQNLIYIWKI